MPAEQFRGGQIHDVVVTPLVKHGDERGWLCEVFRGDELPKYLRPAMGYVSLTEPKVLRGPHEHRRQTDYFAFLGPSRFRVFLWDNRPDSPTYGFYQEEKVGSHRPMCVLVPPGVVHAYQNVGQVAGLVLNFPNQLYRGEGKRETVDELRHEEDPFSPFKIDLRRRRRARKVV